MNPAEEKELSIDTPQGLQEFLRFVEDVYRDFVVALQQKSGTEVMVNGDLLAVETAKRRAEELVARYTKVLEFGGEIFEDNIAELQTEYDIIASAYDRLTKATVLPVATTFFDAPLHTETGLDATLDRARMLAVHADELVYEFSELETAKASTPELKLGKLLYEQLKLTANTTLRKVEEVQQFATIVSGEELLSAAVRIDTDLDELTETLKQLQTSLLRFFEADDFADQTPDRKNATEAMKKNERAAKLFDQQSIFSETLSQLLKNADIRAVLQERYSSPAAFEAALKREVYRVEAPSKLDTLLGVTHVSAFAFLKDMTLTQIDRFDSQPRDQIRTLLQQRDIPYEMYMAWMQAMPYLESYVDAHDEMSFLELFIISEIELVRVTQERNRNSQGVHNQ